MSDEANQGRNRCIDCGALSPATQTNYTLISPRHGWRLSRVVDKEGRKIAEWRCPHCWARHKSPATPPMIKKLS
jgi:hypothetical protein